MSSEGGNLPKTNLGLNPSIKLPPGVMPQSGTPTQDMMDRAFRDRFILDLTTALISNPNADFTAAHLVSFVEATTKGVMQFRKELDK